MATILKILIQLILVMHHLIKISNSLKCKVSRYQLRICRLRLSSESVETNSMKSSSSKSIEKDLLLLDEEIGKNNEMYYVYGNPIISDAQYDALVMKARSIIRQHPLLINKTKHLKNIGFPIADTAAKIKHKTPMSSLENAMSENELLEFVDKMLALPDSQAESLAANQSFILEPKIDGLSLSLVYNNGHLVSASTRGDGKEGEDVLHNAKKVIGISTQIPAARSIRRLEVRGEVYLSLTDFNLENEKRSQRLKELSHELNISTQNLTQSQISLHQPLSNPRNAAVGILRRLEGGAAATASTSLNTTTPPLRFFGYWMDMETGEGGGDAAAADTLPTHLPTFLVPKSQGELLERLHAFGFPTAQPRFTAANQTEVLRVIREFEAVRPHLDYEVDGVVVKVDSLEAQRLLGMGSRAPKWAIAYKFSPAQEETDLLGITVQVGRTGALTPVAMLRPVRLGGVWVERASLHNQGEVRRLGLRPGCRVIVARSGDVIPKVVSRVGYTSPSQAVGEVEGLSVSSEAEGELFSLPSVCPSCGAPTATEEDSNGDQTAVLRCTNESFSCPAQAVEGLRYFCSRAAADIDGLGPSNLQTLFEEGLVRSPADIFTLPDREKVNFEAYVQRKQLLKKEHEDSKAAKIGKKGKKRGKEVETSASSGSESETAVDTPIPMALKEPVEIPVIEASGKSLRELEGWGEKKIAKLVESIERRRILPLPRFLVSLGLRHVGEVTAVDIASAVGSLETLVADVRNNCSIISTVDGVGPKAIGSLQSTFLEPISPVVQNLLKVITVSPVEEKTPVSPKTDKPKKSKKQKKTEAKEDSTAVSNDSQQVATSIQPVTKSDSDRLPLDGMTVILTGKLIDENANAMTREQAAVVCASLGAKMTSSLGKSTDLMIVGDAAGPAKMKKAADLGVRVCGLSEWQNMLRNSRDLGILRR